MAVYVKVPGIYKKFKQAETENRVLFISAPTGYGKSAAFHYYYRRKPSLILNGRTGRLDRMPKPESIRQSVIVFDAVCFINDEESKQYMINMIKYGQKSVILMGRGTLPGWLVSLDMESEFIRADKSDLCFTAKEMVEYLKKNGMETTIEMAEMIIEKVQGFPLLAILYAKNLNGKVEYSEDVYGKAVRELYQIFDEVVWNVWDDTLIKVLLAICEFEHYTVELMEKVTGISKLGHMIEYAYSIGNFVTYLGGRAYRLDERLREYMKWKRTFIYSQEEFLNLYRNESNFLTKGFQHPSPLKLIVLIPLLLRVPRLHCPMRGEKI